MSASNGHMTILFVHGAWHHGPMLEAVANALRIQGAHQVYTPTLAGHRPGDTAITFLDDMVQHLVDYVTERDLNDLVVIAHSSGGVIATQAVPHIRQRVQRVVFHSAFVCANKTRMYDDCPPHFEQRFAQITDPTTQRVKLPYQVWEDFISDDKSIARTTYAKLVAEPVATYETVLDQTPWEATIHDQHDPLPTSYLYSTGDVRLSDDPRGWLKFADRLNEPRIVATNRCHEVYLTDPAHAAERLITAARP